MCSSHAPWNFSPCCSLTLIGKEWTKLGSISGAAHTHRLSWTRSQCSQSVQWLLWKAEWQGWCTWLLLEGWVKGLMHMVALVASLLSWLFLSSNVFRSWLSWVNLVSPVDMQLSLHFSLWGKQNPSLQSHIFVAEQTFSCPCDHPSPNTFFSNAKDSEKLHWVLLEGTLHPWTYLQERWGLLLSTPTP